MAKTQSASLSPTCFQLQLKAPGFQGPPSKALLGRVAALDGWTQSPRKPLWASSHGLPHRKTPLSQEGLAAGGTSRPSAGQREVPLLGPAEAGSLGVGLLGLAATGRLGPAHLLLPAASSWEGSTCRPRRKTRRRRAGSPHLSGSLTPWLYCLLPLGHPTPSSPEHVSLGLMA